MKFGLYLQDHIVPQWEQYYIQYDELKRMIRILADVESKSMASSPTLGKIGFSSLTVPPPTNAAAQPLKTGGVKAPIPREKGEGGNGSGSDDEGVPHDSTITHERFFDFLEKEIQKVHSFTDKKVAEIRGSIARLSQRLKIDANSVPGPQPIAVTEGIKKEVEGIGEEFLKLEKYVNLNYTGFHKILKKHDRWLTNPCRAFYLQRLQAHNWTRGDYSDVMVNMSRIWSCLRGDTAAEATLNEKQDFVRTTTKYWVKDEHISQLKWYVLQHLPVLLQDSEAEGSSDRRDSQLINSVYLDNATLELYRGRLEKTPGAIAIRFRWYGTGTPEMVFVERKTHREAWAMEVSVKERFTVHASEIPSILLGTFDKQTHIQRMHDKGKAERDIEEWDTLVTEVLQAIVSKQLVPTLRTQYMRTAFQIPFDATVRISLDTNLTMLTETGRLGNNDRWFRDPSKPVPRNEITRFPHAVLEVKLQLKDELSKPQWLCDLVESGMLQEVHKFSKFIHGCAVLLPEEVQAMPYWIDDPSLRESVIASGSGHVLAAPGKSGPGANRLYEQLLPNDPKNPRSRAVGPTPRRGPEGASAGGATAPWEPSKGDKALGGSTHTNKPQGPASDARTVTSSHGHVEEDYYEDDDEETHRPSCFGNCCSKLCGWSAEAEFHSRMAIQKVEPKLFFANERTFLHWLNMAVTISSLAAAVLAFSGEEALSEVYGIILLPVSLLFAVYALHTYTWRAAKIRTREQTRWDDPLGPVLLASVFTLALTLQLVLKIYHTYKLAQAGHQHPFSPLSPLPPLAPAPAPSPVPPPVPVIPVPAPVPPHTHTHRGGGGHGAHRGHGGKHFLF